LGKKVFVEKTGFWLKGNFPPILIKVIDCPKTGDVGPKFPPQFAPQIGRNWPKKRDPPQKIFPFGKNQRCWATLMDAD